MLLPTATILCYYLVLPSATQCYETSSLLEAGKQCLLGAVYLTPRSFRKLMESGLQPLAYWKNLEWRSSGSDTKGASSVAGTMSLLSLGDKNKPK